MFQITDLNRQYIGGEWRDGQSESVLADLNPYTQKTIASFHKATPDDIDQAYKAAVKAKKEWDRVGPYEKRAILEKVRLY